MAGALFRRERARDTAEIISAQPRPEPADTTAADMAVPEEDAGLPF